MPEHVRRPRAAVSHIPSIFPRQQPAVERSAPRRPPVWPPVLLRARRPQPSALDLALTAALSAPAPAADMTFAELGLPEALVTALTRRGMVAPFAIQARTLPDALAGRDILGRAQTGSGKTLGFGLPMLAAARRDRRGARRAVSARAGAGTDPRARAPGG